MKNLSKNIAVFIALSIALSSFIACTNSASSSKDGATANTNSASVKNNDFPPAPSGILQGVIKDVDGNTFKLEDKKGKVLLVNLWATWCQPCRAEMPEFVALQDKYKDRDFEIIGLDSDNESADAIKTFAKSMKLNYQLGYADPAFFGEFLKITRMQGIPQTMLIDREGRMTGVFLGGGAANVAKIKESVEKAVSQ